LKPARFWAAAKFLQWGGFGTAGFCLLLILTGGGLLEVVVGVAAAFVGFAASVLAERLGPYRILKEIRVKDVVKPICLTVPYFTRLGDLISKHAFSAGCFCVVVRDGSVLGVLSGEDLTASDFQNHAHDTAEWHMKPLDWLEAVDIADGSAEAIQWINRYRRSFLPVLDGSRLMGIVTKGRIIEEAVRRQNGAPTSAPIHHDREARTVSVNSCHDGAELVSAATHHKET
jgi:CBS-domain-containing membrane protein